VRGDRIHNEAVFSEGEEYTGPFARRSPVADTASMRPILLTLSLLILAAPLSSADGLTANAVNRSLAKPASPTPVWSPPTDLFGPLSESLSYSILGPALDGQGNAYVAIAQLGVGGTVRLVKSKGATGSWEAPVLLYSFPAPLQGYCTGLVTDSAGNATALCTQYDTSGNFQVVALRVSTTAGVLPPVTIYQGPQPYNVLAAADASGDVVTVLGTPFSSNRGAISYIYSAAAQKWLPPVGIAPITSRSGVLDYTLRANRSGTAIFFAYLDQLGYSRSLYAQRFNVGTLTWEAAQLIPGSSGSRTSVQPTGNAQYPLAVDDAGVASLFFQLGERLEFVSGRCARQPLRKRRLGASHRALAVEQ
jgi:hypothetical protein